MTVSCTVDTALRVVPPAAERRPGRRRARRRRPAARPRASRPTPRACAARPAGWPARTPSCSAPTEFDLTTFPNDEGYDELVLARSIPLRAVCEHHLLPFIGVAHVGYLPGERILGLSKLARVVGHFAARPQVQERLTTQVAGWLEDQLAPARRGRGHRGRAHVHDAARGTGQGDDHGDLGAARRAARRPAVAAGVLRTHQDGRHDMAERSATAS